jgi:hypothetical protein
MSVFVIDFMVSLLLVIGPMFGIAALADLDPWFLSFYVIWWLTLPLALKPLCRFFR